MTDIYCDPQALCDHSLLLAPSALYEKHPKGVGDGRGGGRGLTAWEGAEFSAAIAHILHRQ